MSNYPPGVTGNEYEIAGADSEVEDVYFCTTCQATVDGYRETYRGEVRRFHDWPEQPDRKGHNEGWESLELEGAD